ncbi:MAG: hypothetical protein HY514_02070 [Candidatus Aenigmarchaeota archaeon]|nr:hypothetical protein [Candidatus Aenigmarchaeota archaeon]
MKLKDFLNDQGQAQPVDPKAAFRAGYESAMKKGAEDRAYWNRVYMGLEQQGRDYFVNVPEGEKDGVIAACGKTFLQTALSRLPRCTAETHFSDPYGQAVAALAVLRYAPAVLWEDEEVSNAYSALIGRMKGGGANSYADDLLQKLKEAATTNCP